MMDLEELRLLNQDLLRKLRDNQEAFKKRLHLPLSFPSSPDGRKASPENRERIETKGQEPRKPAATSGEKTDAMPAEARASVRMPPTPKSILLTPGFKENTKKKEVGRVTFVSKPTEDAISVERWSVRPFLGYDWIAGLLDAGPSSAAEKPDQYFSELQDFRRANRDACIYECSSRSGDPASSSRERESETDPVSHQCVFCYRMNERLFPQPLNPESACPICKTPRNRRPPETPVEPAFVRVSIPRSTLLPAYKRKIHRRKSYAPSDDLALPSHCLSGWENPLRAFSPTLSSLDLGSSLDAKKGSRALGGTRTDELLDRSRVAEFELGNFARQQKQRHKSPSGKAN